MKSFARKRLRATLILADGVTVFPGTNANTLQLENMRMQARLQGVARLATQAELRIYGMLQADMNAFSVIWSQPPIVLNNILIIDADVGNGYVQVFKGTVTEAQPDYRGAPDVALNISAVTGYHHKITPAAPTSYTVDADIDTIAAGFAAQMELDFINGGAFGTLKKGAYFWGTLWDQLAQACEATNTDFYVFGDKLVITAQGEAAERVPAIKLTPQTGLIGYPSFERSGLIVDAIYDPAMTMGTALEIDGDVPAANGRWYPYSLAFALDALVPNGQWFASMKCQRVLT